MNEIDIRVERYKALHEFDNELKPIALAYEARRKRLHRAISNSYNMTWEEKSELMDRLESLKESKTSIKQEALSLWHSRYPHLDAPSFTPSAILQRISRQKAFDQFSSDPPLPKHLRSIMDTHLAPELQDILEIAKSIIKSI